MEPGMKPRKLKLSSGAWRFLIDNNRTTLWPPSGKHLSQNHADWDPGKDLS
jgi:hypothetical protein